MDELKKIIQSMYHANDFQIPELAARFFEGFIQKYSPENMERVKEFCKQIQKDFSMWDKINDIIEMLGNTPRNSINFRGREDDGLQELLQELSNLPAKRNANLKELATMIMPQAMQYCLMMTNINPATARTKLNRFWKEFERDIYNDIPLAKRNRALPNNGFDIDFLQDEIRKISANLSKLEFCRDKRIDELRLELEAFECVVLQYYKRFTGKAVMHPSKMYALNDFEPCSLCWRFVPKKEAGDNTKTFCDVHQYDPGSKYSQTEYMRALKFPSNKPDSGIFLDRRLTKLLKTLHYVFPVKTGHFPLQIWHDALYSQMSSIIQDKFPQVEYDLDYLWSFCPHVLRFIKEHNGNPLSPQSILAIMDPETSDETEYFRQERKLLHDFLARNFGLYRLELAKAEIFLSDFYAQKDAQKRGGKRPNTGGARPGAGRPKKKQGA